MNFISTMIPTLLLVEIINLTDKQVKYILTKVKMILRRICLKMDFKTKF
jgi:hypothetical protein